MSMRNAVYGAAVKVMSRAASRNMDLPEREERHEQVRATVVGVRELAPNLRRLTLGGDGFGGMALNGADEYVGLIMPRPGHELEMPDPDIANVRAAAKAVPVDLRWYTIRELRPEDGGAAAEVDIDIVTHGDSGPGSAWALGAKAGDEVGIRFTGHCHYPHAGEQFYLADATAAPALRAIIESATPEELAGFHVLVVGDEDHLEPGLTELLADDSPRPASLTIIDDADGVAGYLADAPFDVGDLTYAWLCGESALATGSRRALVAAGMAKGAILFSGYWKEGAART